MNKLLICIMFLAAPAHANMMNYKLMKKEYEGYKVSCNTCHIPKNRPLLNPYGLDLEMNDMNFYKIEGFDSDGDGFGNLTEIHGNSNPGSKDSVPSIPPFEL